MAKRGRKKKQFDPQVIIKLIENDEINPYINDIKKVLGCSYSTLKRYIEENPEVEKALELRKTEIVEKAEETIMEILNNKEHRDRAGIAKWVLSVRANKYKEKLQSDVTVDGAININIIKDKK